MFYTVVIFDLFILVKISISVEYCSHDSLSRLTNCKDGGCGYIESDGTTEKCVCSFSNGVMGGEHCSVYVNRCQSNPCKNGGKCTSGIGHHVCECSDDFYGISCEIPKQPSKFNNKIPLYFVQLHCNLEIHNTVAIINI